MSEFFEPPPPPPAEPEVCRQPPWFGPPRGTLPGVVALEFVLAQTDRAAVCITRLAAYPTGFAFETLALSAPGQDGHDLLDPMLFGPGRHRVRGGGGELSSELLRIGVQFADGRKATNVSGFSNVSGFYHDTEPPTGPVMLPGGGGGGGGNWHEHEWVWPLPPPGPVAFVCEWPAAGIPLTRREIDAQLILDAAAGAKVIFSDEHLPTRSSSTSAPQSPGA